jgi:hypothetical protein
MVGESGTRQSAAYEFLPPHYGIDSGKQVIVSIRFNYVTMPITESYTRHIYINLLTQEEYFGIGSDFANPSSGFNPIKLWQSNIQQNHVRLQFFCFLNRLESIRRDPDDAHNVILPELLDYETTPRSKIIYQENTDKRIISDSLLLFRVQNQIDRVVVNWLPDENSIPERLDPVVALEQLWSC